MNTKVYDLVGLLALAMISAGTAIRFGYEISLITTGIILLVVTLIAARRV